MQRGQHRRRRGRLEFRSQGPQSSAKVR